MQSQIQKELSTIAIEIIALLPNAQVFLFGSYAIGKESQYSDLDLCVVLPEFPARRMETLHSIRNAICDKTSLPIDILLFRSDEFARNSKMKPTIEYAIAKNGVLISA